ncbi:MAG: BlaI/MecI/CopY family transcriptional regulator [Pirellulaceae bacterium]
MARKPQDVTQAELAVLRQLWEQGPQTIRQLTTALYAGDDAQYSTVKKLLERLEAKDCVSRDRGDAVHVFAAAVGRDDLVDRRLREVAESLCDGSITPLLTHAARHERLTKKQRELLRSLIDDLQE